MNTWVKPCSFPSDLASMVRRRSTFNVPTFNGYHQPKKNCACNATVPPMIVNRQSQIGNVLLAAFCRPLSAFCSSPAPVLPSAAVLPCTLSAAICLPVFRNSQCSPCCLLVSRISPFAIRNVSLAAFWSLTIRHSTFAIAPASVPHYAVPPLPAPRCMVTCVPCATRRLSSLPGRRPAGRAGPASERAKGCPA